jgi:hypothetical protein
MLALFQDLDLFEKTDRDELRQQSTLGSIVTFVTVSLSLASLCVHFVVVFHSRIYRELLIAPTVTNQDSLINISLSVEVDLPCYFIHIDSLDSLGYSRLNINMTITLRRVNASGSIIGIANSSFSDNCLPCYGLLPEGQCCSSCDQLIVLSLFSGKQPTQEKWMQCKGGARTPIDISLDEKCLVKGKITVNKAAGAFHIAAGRNVKTQFGHQHDTSFQLPDLSFRHKIERLRFGLKLPVTCAPLENILHQEKSVGPAMYRYNLILTPVILYRNGVLWQRGFEYTAFQTRWEGVPGLFFWYRFTPYTVAVHVRTRNVAQAATSLAGFLAGVWAAMSLIDRLIADCRKST